ncbi:nucleotidyl transferase AbiEii/AbiGii toxin family protein [Sorangium sp. So ce448]|uniref:nucleotidyl transferase AbiEii/AbiGii toxin family protein n=1 Tax=Sorangium sp. So ce448 TaxID=3133314 RepID=UPI003F607893
MSLIRSWLELMPRTGFGADAVLRGSQLTASWVPGRVAADLDFVLMGDWSLDRATRVVNQLLGSSALPAEGVVADLGVKAWGIWLETPWPGLRLELSRGERRLQVDFGWGEVLGVAPRPFELEGFTLPAVAPEVMFAWKVHSLVELGPRGRWHPKTLIDLVLLARHCTLDPAATKRCVESAFASREMSLSALDAFFTAEDWGSGRSSRHKWKKYVATAPWVTFSRTDAIREAREVVRSFLHPVS